MSTVPYTIGTPNTGGTVDHYALAVTVDGATTTIEPATLSGSFTLAAGKMASVVATAVNSAGRTATPAQTVTAPAAVAMGPNDLKMTDAAFAGGRMVGGLGTVAFTVPPQFMVGFKFELDAAPSAEINHIWSVDGGTTGMLVKSDGHLLTFSGGNTADTGIVISDTVTHYLLMQADASGNVNTWVDGVFAKFGGYSPQSGSNLIISAAGSTAPGVFYGDRPGCGAISEFVIYNTAPYSNFQSTTPVPAGPLTGAEPGVVRLWHLNTNGLSAV